jgi:hypothetical protein
VTFDQITHAPKKPAPEAPYSALSPGA